MRQEIIEKLSVLNEEEKKLLSGEETVLSNYSLKKPVLIDSTGILSNGKMIGTSSHSRFVETGLHRHNYIEIMYMYKGKTTHIINDNKAIDLNENELLLLNQHALHYVKKSEINDIGINIIIKPEFFDMSLELAGVDNYLTSFLINGIKTRGDGVSYLHFKVADVHTVQSAVDALMESLFDESDVRQRSAKLALALLLAQLSLNTHTIEMAQPQNKGNAIVSDAISLIESSYRDATVKTVANKHGVSDEYVSMLVKNAMGETFKSLLIKKRVAKAKEFLLYTDLSIQDICFTVGYENISHFYKIFKEAYGCSPASYRKKNKSQNV